MSHSLQVLSPERVMMPAPSPVKRAQEMYLGGSGGLERGMGGGGGTREGEGGGERGGWGGWGQDGAGRWTLLYHGKSKTA
jgi:hypothetical protein